MKKKVAMLLTGVMAVSLMMTGCQSAKGLETENVKISVYKGVEVDKVDKPSEVTDDDVNTQIQSVLDENSTTEEVTGRAVKKGDTATIDFVGKMNGEAFDGGSSTDYPLEIGSNSFIDGFEDSIIGHNAGDTFDWNGKFPENYGSSDLAGKDVTFTITVKSISKKKTPKLTDKFVKKVSKESKTVEEYKDWLLNNSREQLEFILLDLIRLSENKEILCDCHLTVAQTLAFSEPSRVVFLIKEPSNLVDEYGNRPDHQGFLRYLNSATDVEKAKQTVNTTLYEINVNRIEEIKNSDFFWIERTWDSTVEDTLSRVEKHLGLI